MKFILVLLTVFLPLASVSAQYRWTDEKGGLHFSDEPPPSGKIQVMPKYGGPGAKPAEHDIAPPAKTSIREALQACRTVSEGESCCIPPGNHP